MGDKQPSAVLHRNIREDIFRAVRGEGIYLFLSDGTKILDAAGGAAVSCVGHGNSSVKEAVVNQFDTVEFATTVFFTTDVCESLCEELIASTGGRMSRAIIVNSG